MRPLATFLESPSSVRNTIRVLVVASVLTTLLGGVSMWLFAGEDFDSFGDAMWWSLQTVTTVGYGDATPSTTIGRLIGSLFMLYAVAFMAILTAAITATFVDHARARRRVAMSDADLATLLGRLEEIKARLDRLEPSPARGEPKVPTDPPG